MEITKKIAYMNIDFTKILLQKNLSINHDIIFLRPRKWEAAAVAVSEPPPPFPFNTRITIVIAAAIPSRMSPTFKWNLSQDMAVKTKYRGIAIKNAANRIANPKIPEMIPPTRGIKPNNSTIGEKNRYIPSTMQRNESILKVLVKHSDFYIALSKTSCLERRY